MGGLFTICIHWKNYALPRPSYRSLPNSSESVDSSPLTVQTNKQPRALQALMTHGVDSIFSFNCAPSALTGSRRYYPNYAHAGMSTIRRGWEGVVGTFLNYSLLPAASRVAGNRSIKLLDEIIRGELVAADKQKLARDSVGNQSGKLRSI